jgi:hypothetical protein
LVEAPGLCRRPYSGPHSQAQCALLLAVVICDTQRSLGDVRGELSRSAGLLDSAKAEITSVIQASFPELRPSVLAQVRKVFLFLKID